MTRVPSCLSPLVAHVDPEERVHIARSDVAGLGVFLHMREEEGERLPEGSVVFVETPCMRVDMPSEAQRALLVDGWYVLHPDTQRRTLARVLTAQAVGAASPEARKLLDGCIPHTLPKRGRVSPAEVRHAAWTEYAHMHGADGSSGLYRFGAALNHGCTPNVAVYAAPAERLHKPDDVGSHVTYELRCVALRELRVGEELFVDYLPRVRGALERLGRLHQCWDFWCNCPSCAVRARGMTADEIEEEQEHAYAFVNGGSIAVKQA